MTIEQIEKFIDLHARNNLQPVKISFKARNQLNGIFIRASDYDELKKKNFWRIVTSTRLDSYRQSKDLSHTRMFNGAEFTKLSLQ